MFTNILLIILILMLCIMTSLVVIWWVKYGKKLFNAISKITNVTGNNGLNKPKLDVTQLLNEMNKLNNMFKK